MIEKKRKKSPTNDAEVIEKKDIQAERSIEKNILIRLALHGNKVF